MKFDTSWISKDIGSVITSCGVLFHVNNAYIMSRQIIVSYAGMQALLTVILSHLSYYLYLTFINDFLVVISCRATTFHFPLIGYSPNGLFTF